MSETAQNTILGLALEQVLSQYKGETVEYSQELKPVYEQHFHQIAALSDTSVDVKLTRQHFNSLLQEQAFEAILKHIQGPVSTEELSKDQFLELTHLISCTLEAAQNSDALWVEPEMPISSAHKKRHPTVQESLAPRILAHWGQENLTPGNGSQPGELQGKEQAAKSTVVNQKTQDCMSETAAEEDALGGLLRPSEVSSSMASKNTNITKESHGGIAVTKFEHKLQELMQRMQLDRATLQRSLTIEAKHGLVHEASQVAPIMASTNTETNTLWESFDALPVGQVKLAGRSSFDTMPASSHISGKSSNSQSHSHYVNAIDSGDLSVAMQQLSLQQAFALQNTHPVGAPELFLETSSPETAAAIARAQVQLEAAAASLVAAATARPHRRIAASSSELFSHEAHGSSPHQPPVSRCSGVDKSAVPFTARNHYEHANAKLGHMQSSSASHALGPLGAAEYKLQQRPIRLLQQSPPMVPCSTPMTARLAQQSDIVDLSSWEAMPHQDLERCQQLFIEKGFEALGGMSKQDAQKTFVKMQMAPHLFEQVWSVADGDKNNTLDKQEFCLFMYLLRMVQKGYPVPLQLTDDQTAKLLGYKQQPIKLDFSKIKSVLKTGKDWYAAGAEIAEHDRQGTQRGIGSEFDDSISMCSHSSSPFSSNYITGPPSLANSSLPAVPARMLPSDCGNLAIHTKLALNIQGAEVHYNKTLEKPFFNVSVYDSLLRIVELPQDTPPGHYRQETRTISLDHVVELQTQLAKVPRGSVVYIELKHFKSREGRMSTLAWSYFPLEKVVDSGPMTQRVREGPLNLPLYRKPVDLSLRKLRRAGRHDDLRLTVTGMC